MSGVKDIRGLKQNIDGSITVEAAIALPVFILVVFSIAYIIRIFFTYNTVQISLNEVTRKIGNMSYFYHLSGVKEYSDALNEASNDAQGTLSNQYDTLQNAFASFNDIVSGVSAQRLDPNNIQEIINQMNMSNGSVSDVSELIQNIMSNPKSELELFCTIFAQRLNYEINNIFISQISRELLSREFDIRTDSSNGKGAYKLNIENGIKGVDFNDSSVFGDGESLEFVVNYSIKVPFISNIKLTNRVKYIAWTGGRGKSIKVEEDESTEKDSLWTKCDNNKQYWERGNTIEKSEVDKIIKGAPNGSFVRGTGSKHPTIDAYAYNNSDKSVQYYDVFSLNPFLKTFSQRSGAINKEIKKHGASLANFEGLDIVQNFEINKVKRILIIVIPENSEQYAIDEYNSAKAELSKMNIEVRLVKGYGSYQFPQSEQSAQAYERSIENEYYSKDEYTEGFTIFNA